MIKKKTRDIKNIKIGKNKNSSFQTNFDSTKHYNSF